MPPRRWTTEELNTADKMLSDGASFVDIGKAIDRSAAAVESKLKGKSTPKPNQWLKGVIPINPDTLFG